MRNALWITSIFYLTAVPTVTFAQELTEERVKELVLETIRENPGIVLEAAMLMRERDEEARMAAQIAVLERNREVLLNDPNAPVLGNPDGDVTVVEFFDYNCPYCRQVKPSVEMLLEEDPEVKLVYREWPILGEGSVFAARAALAAREQGKYEEFHWAMMGMQGRAEEASVLRIATEIGLDIDRLRRDMESEEIDEHLATSVRLTQELGFNGTPAFVIGDVLVPGVIEVDQMLQLTEQARQAND